MPRWSVWSVRLALAWLALAALVGAGILARDPLGLPGAATLIPAHAEMMLVGWMMQLACGVAWWILPGRFRHDPNRITFPLAIVSLGLNGGILLLVLGVPLMGRGCEGVAAVMFAWQVAPRVRTVEGEATGKGSDLVRLKQGSQGTS